VRSEVDVFVVAAGEGASRKAFQISEILRDQTDLRILQNAGGGSFKSQFKKADKSGARLALILGEQELESDTIVVKNLLDSTEQIVVKQTELVSELLKQFH